MTKTKEQTLSISLRTLTWLGIVVFLFALGVTAVILVYTPPATATLILLFTFVFLSAAGLGTAVAAFLLQRWHRHMPHFALFQGVMTGNLAMLLLLLQYFQVLDWITLFMVVLFIFVSEVVYYQTRKIPSKPEPKKNRGKRKQTSGKSGKKQSAKDTLAAQRPRRTTRVRKTRGQGKSG